MGSTHLEPNNRDDVSLGVSIFHQSASSSQDPEQIAPRFPSVQTRCRENWNPHKNITHIVRPATTTWGKAEREIGSAADAETETTPLDPSATDASSLVSLSTPKRLPIPNGFLASGIGSALVSSLFSSDFLLCLFRSFVFCWIYWTRFHPWICWFRRCCFRRSRV